MLLLDTDLTEEAMPHVGLYMTYNTIGHTRPFHLRVANLSMHYSSIRNLGLTHDIHKASRPQRHCLGILLVRLDPFDTAHQN